MRALLTFILFLVSAPWQVAIGCSCETLSQWGLTHETDGALPSNAKGIVWWGYDPGIPFDDGTPRLRIRERNTTHDLALDTSLLYAGHRLSGNEDATLRYWRLMGGWEWWLVRPADGFKAGAQYVIRFEREWWPRKRESRVVHLKINNDVWTDAGNTSLAVSEKTLGYFSVPWGISCGTIIQALHVDVEMVLPEPVRDFRSQMHFKTLVDGKFWQYAETMCDNPVPGIGRGGPGRDRLYVSCNESRSVDELKPGMHEVQMLGYLPGSDEAVVSASTVIEMRCPSS